LKTSSLALFVIPFYASSLFLVKLFLGLDFLFAGCYPEVVSVETKMNVEAVLDMKAQHGEFIGPRASFGYQKSSKNPNQLIPDPATAAIFKRIFEMDANGEGATAIVRYLNEHGFPAPIQYARLKGWPEIITMAVEIGTAGR